MRHVIKFISIVILFVPLSTYAIKIDPPVVFEGVGNEKMRACTSFDCDSVKYGGYLHTVEIIELSGDWYKVRYIERSSEYANRNNLIIPFQEHVLIELPKSQWTTTVGWMYYSVIPEKTLSKIRGGSDAGVKKKDEVIGTAVLKKHRSNLLDKN